MPQKQSQILKTQYKANRVPTLAYGRASAKHETNAPTLSQPNGQHKWGITGNNEGEATRSKAVRNTFP